MQRWKGSIHSSTAVVSSSSSASGIWTPIEIAQAKQAGAWPAPAPPGSNILVDYLVVAGGGGGGGWQGGGGGAGGLLTATSVTYTLSTSYTVVIGAAGAGGTFTGSGDDRGTNGSGSTFANIVTAGGGRAGAYNNSSTYAVPSDGGSGGGPGSVNPTVPAGLGNTPATIPSQGNDGGLGNANSFNESGGGGAGSIGGTGITSTGQYAGMGGLGKLVTGFATTFSGTGNITTGLNTLTIATTTTGAVKVGTVIAGSGMYTAQSIAITSISGATDIVTINYATQGSIPFSVGQVILIAGVTTTTTYNGPWRVLTSSTTSTTVASSVSGTGVVTGATISSPATYIVSGSAPNWVMSTLSTATATGTALTSTGDYYAGGGGGGPDSTTGASTSNSGPSVGGAGGGGAGVHNAAGVAGSANTGGGGGGSYGASGGAGGSGVIFLKIPSTNTATFTGATTTLDSSVSGYKIYKVTAATAGTVTFS